MIGGRWDSGRASGPPIIHSSVFPILSRVQNRYHTRSPQPASAGDVGIVHFTPKTRCHPPKLETISPPREGDSQTRGGKDEETVRVTHTYSYLIITPRTVGAPDHQLRKFTGHPAR